jgi:hypothetical protein
MFSKCLRDLFVVLHVQKLCSESVSGREDYLKPTKTQVYNKFILYFNIDT